MPYYIASRRSLLGAVDYGELLVKNQVCRSSRETRPIERVLGLTGGTLQGQKKWVKSENRLLLAGRRLQKVDEVKSVEQLKRGGYKDTTEEVAMKKHRFVLPA